MTSNTNKYKRCDHTRADLKLQWQILIAIYELLSVHTSGEKKRGSFLCSSDMLIAISIEIEFLLENVRFVSGSGRKSRSSAPQITI